MDEQQSQNEASGVASALNGGLCAMLRNAAAADRLAFELEQQARHMADRMAFVGPHLCESAASEIERLQDAITKAAAQIRRCDYTPARSTLLEALVGHNAEVKGGGQ